MDALNTTHRLLFQALLEIREEGRRIDNKPIYGLADLFHNVVLQLEAIAAGSSKVTYDDILIFIKQHAKSRGWDKWVDERIRELRFAIGRASLLTSLRRVPLAPAATPAGDAEG